MLNSFIRVLVPALVSSAFFVSAALARQQAPPAESATRPQLAPPKRVRAVRIPNGRINIDGRLSEAEWAQAQPATDFVQQQPDEGRPTTEPTAVRFLYDDEYLYVGGRLSDREPSRLITNELKREFGARDGDLFVVVLDTFSDKLNAYTFQTNPGGAIRDAQSSDDGRNINQNWDAIWDVAISVTGDAWIVEERIPFKTLRFTTEEEQVWGLQIFRLIRRKNEQTMWNPVPRQYGQFKVSYAGVLEGISDVAPGRNIRVKPFVTASGTDVAGGRTGDFDGGLDVKIGVGPSLVLDGTLRTDFSQVEADEQQVNLTRFNLFFPEKRELFLENQGAFQFGPPATNASNLVPFFSRTIGLSEAGTPVPIVGGARLTGKAGRNLIGVLNMQTEKEPAVNGRPALPAANFSVLRYGREFLSNSSVGVFYMGKERGEEANRLGGADLKLALMRSMNIDALWMRSEKTGVGQGTAWRTGFDWDTTLSRYQVSYTSLGDAFRDDLGFIPRQGVDILTASVNRRLRPSSRNARVREYTPELAYSRYTRDGLGVETETFTPALGVTFADGATATATSRFNEEALSTAFRIRPEYSIPVGRYRFLEGDVGYQMSRARRLSLNGTVRFGEFWNGTRHGWTLGGRLRVDEHLAVTLGVTRNEVDLPGVAFTTDLVTLRVDQSFTTRMFLNAFIQYNSVTRQVLSNVRFNFMHHPLSDLFIVYNETTPTAGGSRVRSRSVAIKATHLFGF